MKDSVLDNTSLNYCMPVYSELKDSVLDNSGLKTVCRITKI